MKRSYIFVFMFVIISACLTLFGCSFGSDIKGIYIVGQTQEAKEIEIGQFSYDDYKLGVEYKNGNKEEIDLTEDMISETERVKFFQVGEQSVKVIYKNAECEIKINVTRKKLSNLTLKDKVATYTGEPITLEVEGVIFADVTVRYPNGNSFTNAGVYDVTAICYGDNYEIKQLSATLTIKKATYDMSKIVFANQEYIYDKNPKSIAISGELPNNVKVEYSIGNKQGNSETNAGTYVVTAKFTSQDENYEQIEDKTATLTIKKATVEGIDIKMENKNVVFSGESYSISAQINKLPKTVSTNYTIQKILDANGNEVSEEEKSGNSATGSGTYVVKLNFTLLDTANYESVESLCATLFIDQKEYDLSSVNMFSASFEYDGSSHSISLCGEKVGDLPVLPQGVSVTYTIKKIKNENGEEINEEAKDGNEATEVGTYEITAIFTTNDENYKKIESKTAILEITAKGEES